MASNGKDGAIIKDGNGKDYVFDLNFLLILFNLLFKPRKSSLTLLDCFSCSMMGEMTSNLFCLDPGLSLNALLGKHWLGNGDGLLDVFC